MKTSVSAIVAFSCFISSCKERNEAGTARDGNNPPPELTEPAPPAALPVTDPEEFKVGEEEPGDPSPTPGERLDHAIGKTADGLETARDKTEEGLRNAAGKTGEFLQRTGEAIERKASGR